MLKLKGRYAFDVFPHQDPSALIVPIIAKKVMVDGENLETALSSHKNAFDFMLRAKIPRANSLFMRYDYCDFPLGHIIRFYVSDNGGYLINIKPQKHEIGQYKRANKLSDDYFDTIMNEIGKDVWDERVHTKNQKVYPDHEETGICAGWTTTDCSDAGDFNWNDLNYDYYKQQIEKIIIT